MSRRLLLLALLALLLVPAPADAAGQVVVSADGQTWTPSLTTPLFDPAVRWVPGDARTATFHVGNRAADAGTLALVVTADDAHALIARDDITLAVRRGSGPWVDVRTDGQPHRLAGGDLAAGADTRLAIRATFAPASRNLSQLRSLPLSFDVVLSESTTTVSPPTDPGHGGSGGHGGLLPDTGGVELWVLLAGLLLLALGAIVVRTATFPPRKDDDEQARL